MNNDIELYKSEVIFTVDAVIGEMARLKIENDTQYETAGAWLVKNKETQKIVENKFAPLKKELYEPYKNVLDTTKFFMDKLILSEKVIKQQMAKYYQEKQRKLEEEKRVRDAEEKKRLEEEAWIKAEDKKLQRAIEEDDDSILNEKIEISPVEVLEVKIEKQNTPDGIYFVDNWTYKIIDPKIIPDEYKIVDEKAIARIVKTLKNKTNIPGIEIFNDKQTRVKTA